MFLKVRVNRSLLIFKQYLEQFSNIIRILFVAVLIVELRKILSGAGGGLGGVN